MLEVEELAGSQVKVGLWFTLKVMEGLELFYQALTSKLIQFLVPKWQRLHLYLLQVQELVLLWAQSWVC